MIIESVTDDKQSELLAIKLYDFLKTHKYLKDFPSFDPDTEWLIMDRSKTQVCWNSRLLWFLNSKEPDFLTLCSKNDILKTFSKEIEVMPYEILAHMALSQYEILKRCLTFALKLETLNIKPNASTTYGTIISKLDHKGLEKCIVKAFDNKLRNIIAHGSWYVKDKQFFYLEEQKKQCMTYDELLTRVDNFTQFSNRFFRIYWENHIPANARYFAAVQMIKDGETTVNPET